MTRFQHILVPVDFGAAMHPGIDLAVVLARKFDSRVTLVHAFDISPFTAISPLATPVIDVEPLLETAEKELKDVLSKVRVEWPKSEAVIRRGRTEEVILDVAKGLGCGLIVIGTHGRRGVARVLLGSIAEKIVRMSPIPVLTVHPLPQADSPGA
jgi:nucleotide-binding universal stress UspA family protein